MFDICLLGTGGMMPLPERFLTSLIARYNGTAIMIDCGEGTQIQLQKLGWSFKDISTILFTHYHGDHITGLSGIIFQMINSGKTDKLTLIGPTGINILKNLSINFMKIPFEVEFIEINNDSVLNIGDITVKNFKLKHSTNCYGYSLEVKRLPEFNPNKAKELNIPLKYWKTLQYGKSIDGFTPEMVLGENRKGLKITYCTDTRPVENIIKFADSSDLFICEGMYGDDSEIDKAKDKLHMTFSEAANLASSANVKELWLTHYGPSLRNPHQFLYNAQKIFGCTKIGKDLMCKILSYED